ncbi:MAG: 5-formyltetrahydrofolate cyclo-ligase [Candidatus Methylacidiphilales bacterium]
MGVISEEKARLRTELQNALRTLSVSQRHQASSRIQKFLFDSHLWKSSQTIMLFSALPGEPRTIEILRQALQEDKICAYPKVHPATREMKLYSVRSPERLVRGNYGILEPDTDHAESVDISRVELICVPGLGFDPLGNRLGRGYGFYDRFLNQRQFTGRSAGLHFKCQLVPTIPTQSHDQKVDYLLNEIDGLKDVS